MTSKRTEKLARLFDNYSKNLSFYAPQYEHTFVCPLCLRPFGKSELDAGELTIEHIIPAALGGKLTTITCKACNSMAGHSLDAHLVQRLKTEDILAGKDNTALNVRIKVGKGEFGADAYLDPEHNPNIRLVANSSISDPTLFKLAIQELESSQGQVQFSMSGNFGYRELSSRVAVLRCAYLLMFRTFGYGYILYGTLDKVRAQIFDPTIETDVLRGLFWLEDVSATNAVAVLREPSEYRCFLAILDLSTKVNRYLAVVLPGLDKESESIYQHWSKVNTTHEIYRNLRPDFILYDPAYIYNPEHSYLPTKLWSWVNNFQR